MSLTRRELLTFWRGGAATPPAARVRRPAAGQMARGLEAAPPAGAGRQGQAPAAVHLRHPGGRRAPGSAAAARLPLAMVPRVDDARCLALTSFCTVCSERCPVDGAIERVAGRPVVVSARCDGCGQCLAACPAPVLALTLVRR